MCKLVILKIVGVQELILRVWANNLCNNLLFLMWCPMCCVLGITPR